MRKQEMAIEIASALFNKDVDEDNWKVKQLVAKNNKAALQDQMPLAESINAKRRVSISDLLFSSPCGKEGCCRNVDCDTAVVYHKVSNRWFITFGHAGFNAPANNANGYANKASAKAIIRHYLRRSNDL